MLLVLEIYKSLGTQLMGFTQMFTVTPITFYLESEIFISSEQINKEVLEISCFH